MRLAPIALTLAAVQLAACSFHGDVADDADGGPRTTRSFPLADFTAVALKGADDVDIRVGTGFSVRAEGPARDLDQLRIIRDGDTLKVGRVESSGFDWGRRHGKVTVFVTMPRIMASVTAGSGDMKIDRVEGQRFSGEIAGSGNLAIAALTASEARLAISGSGDVSTKGSVGLLAVDIVGSGNVDAGGLKATGATISVAGSGDVHAEVAGAATVSLTGSGDVDLGKSARCRISKTGSGTVTCGG